MSKGPQRHNKANDFEVLKVMEILKSSRNGSPFTRLENRPSIITLDVGGQDIEQREELIPNQ